jgi:hypothetical protein
MNQNIDFLTFYAYMRKKSKNWRNLYFRLCQNLLIAETGFDKAVEGLEESERRNKRGSARMYLTCSARLPGY